MSDSTFIGDALSGNLPAMSWLVTGLGSQHPPGSACFGEYWTGNQSPRADDSQTNHCVGTFGAGQSCTVNITFTPTAAGTRKGTITVSDNEGSRPQAVTLAGTGQ